MYRWFTTLMLAATLVVAAGCSKDDNPTGTANGTLRVQMTDAPAVYDAIRLVVKEVAVHRTQADTTGGWEILTTEPSTLSMTEFDDYFDRMVSRTDLGNHLYNYTYNLAGQLISQTNNAGQSISYGYTANGYISSIVDSWWRRARWRLRRWGTAGGRSSPL